MRWLETPSSQGIAYFGQAASDAEPYLSAWDFIFGRLEPIFQTNHLSFGYGGGMREAVAAISEPTAMDLSSIYSGKNRTAFLVGAALLIVLIAIIDWLTKPYISIGFLYLFPIMLIAGFLPRWQIVLVALFCAVLQELFSELPSSEAITRLLMASAGFVGTGLFVSEIIRSRQMAIEHMEEVETHSKLRQEAEQQLRILVDSSPAAIVTIDESGRILLANAAARNLFATVDAALVGQSISEYLPALLNAVQTHRTTQFRTELRCRGRRSDGEAFLAAVWFSTYSTAEGSRLAAIIVDLSEELRDREDLSLDNLLKNTKILMGAVAHEIRNVCGAILAVYKNLSRFPNLQNEEDFRALGSLIEGLEKLSEMELLSPSSQNWASIELTSLLDELRVLIEPAYHEGGCEILWRLQDNLPVVIGDRYGLQQVFLNLARNSQRAMEASAERKLTISGDVLPGAVVIRFEDTGEGISNPYELFKPFQPGANSTGLGLYVSRAILRSFGGELKFEPRSKGCCFAVTLARV